MLLTRFFFVCCPGAYLSIIRLTLSACEDAAEVNLATREQTNERTSKIEEAFYHDDNIDLSSRQKVIILDKIILL